MNSTKKKHNWKARRETKTEIDKSEENKVGDNLILQITSN